MEEYWFFVSLLHLLSHSWKQSFLSKATWILHFSVLCVLNVALENQDKILMPKILICTATAQYYWKQTYRNQSGDLPFTFRLWEDISKRICPFCCVAVMATPWLSHLVKWVCEQWCPQWTWQDQCPLFFKCQGWEVLISLGYQSQSAQCLHKFAFCLLTYPCPETSSV